MNKRDIMKIYLNKFQNVNKMENFYQSTTYQNQQDGIKALNGCISIKEIETII